LILGHTLHGLVEAGSSNIYYTIVSRDSIRNASASQQDILYGVLTSLKGNSDLYVQFQDNPYAFNNMGSWK